MSVLHWISSFEGTAYKKLQDIATNCFISLPSPPTIPVLNRQYEVGWDAQQN